MDTAVISFASSFLGTATCIGLCVYWYISEQTKVVKKRLLDAELNRAQLMAVIESIERETMKSMPTPPKGPEA